MRLFQTVIIFTLLLVSVNCGGDILPSNVPPDNSNRIRFQLTSLVTDTVTVTDTEGLETDVDRAYAFGFSDKIYQSLNGIVWTQQEYGAEDFYVSATADSGDGFVSVGALGNVYSSEDVTEWTLTETITNQPWLNDIMYDSDTSEYVAAGDADTYVTSADGETWTVETGPASSTDAHWRAIARTGTNYLLMGLGGILAESTDSGDSWTASDVDTETASAQTNVTIHNVAFMDPDSDGGFFLAVGNSGVCLKIANDFSTYEVIDLGFTDDEDTAKRDLFDVAYLNDELIVIVGEGGYITTSADSGATWTEESSAANEDYFKVGYVLEKYVAIGADRAINYRATVDEAIVWSNGTLVD